MLALFVQTMNKRNQYACDSLLPDTAGQTGPVQQSLSVPHDRGGDSNGRVCIWQRNAASPGLDDNTDRAAAPSTLPRPAVWPALSCTRVRKRERERDKEAGAACVRVHQPGVLVIHPNVTQTQGTMAHRLAAPAAPHAHTQPRPLRTTEQAVVPPNVVPGWQHWAGGLAQACLHVLLLSRCTQACSQGAGGRVDPISGTRCDSHLKEGRQAHLALPRCAAQQAAPHTHTQ
jgi:hypothetical protein